MRIEWKEGTRLTKKRALFLCYKLWEWLVEECDYKGIRRGDESIVKSKWPHWDSNGGKVSEMAHVCPCCEYKKVNKKGCLKCLLLDLWGGDVNSHTFPCCHNKSPFTKWVESETIRTRKKYARIIANFAKKEYEKCR